MACRLAIDCRDRDYNPASDGDPNAKRKGRMVDVLRFGAILGKEVDPAAGKFVIVDLLDVDEDEIRPYCKPIEDDATGEILYDREWYVDLDELPSGMQNQIWNLIPVETSWEVFRYYLVSQITGDRYGI